MADLTAGPGLYIHVPFCRAKCSYCDFASEAGREDLQERYVKAVLTETEGFERFHPVTMYLGGGTPTLLETDLLIALIEGALGAAGWSACREITVEANPDSLTREKLVALRARGVNRLSIGLQAFSDRHLQALGRIHSVKDFERAYAGARRAGFENINIDLMYGIPDCDAAEWRRTLDQAVACTPEHLSLYPLTVEPGTPLAASGTRIDPDAQAALYEYAAGFLPKMGYRRYEISNWALPGYECAHNLNYWTNGSYRGAGASAAGHWDGERTVNLRGAEPYITAVEEGRSPVEEREAACADRRLAEEIILGLRLEGGLRISDTIRARFGGVIERLSAGELLETTGDSMRLSGKGVLLANQVMREFV